MSTGAAPSVVPPGRPPRAALAVGLWLLAIALGVAVILRTPFHADLSGFLPQSPDARQQVLIEQLQSGVASRTLFIGIEGGRDAAQRARLSRALGDAMRKSGLFDQVQNGDTGAWQDAGTWVFDHRYLLSAGVAPERFTVAGLRDGIVDSLSLLGTPAGNLLRPLFERDPTGEVQRIAEGLIPAGSPRSDEGVWASREHPRAVLLAGTHAAGGDLDAQAAALAFVHRTFDEALAADGGGGARPVLQMTGAPVFGVQSREQIRHEAIQLAVVGGIVMCLLLLAAFASPRALLLSILPVATGVVGGTAAVGLAFGNVHGMTMGFGSTLIGESVDYAIYYLIQARGAAAGSGGWRHWVRAHWPTVRLGLLTSIAGFAALVFSGFPGLAQLGVFSLAGLASAALVARFVMPVFAPGGAAGQGLRGHLARATGGLLTFLPQLRLLFLLAGALALAGVLWLGTQGRLWTGQLGDMSPVPRALQQLDESLRADIGASDGGTLVVVQGRDLQDALRATEAAGAKLDGLVDAGRLTGYESVARLLPSEAAQAARRASLPEAPVLRERLAQAVQGLPLTADRLAPFVEAVDAARGQPLVTRESLQATPLAPVASALMFERPGGGWSTLIALHPGPGWDAPALQQALAGLPQVQVINVGDELRGLYARYLHEAFVQVLLGAAVVVLLLALWLRSARRLVAVCAPLVLAVLLTLGGMAVLRVPLGILHLIGMLLVVAVGSNYALFFDQLRQDGRADENTLASLLLANLTTVISFGLIAISDIPALSAIGRVVAPGALLALFLSAALMGVRRGRGAEAH